MQSQQKLSENYQELINSLMVVHPDLDLKLTQSQFNDNPDVLKAVFIKVSLKSQSSEKNPKNDLKPLDLLTKNDLLQAKLSYLTDLKAQKMEEQETSEEDFDELFQITQENVENYKKTAEKFPRRLAKEQEILKELEFIKSVSYALQQIMHDINYQEPQKEKEEKKNHHIDVLKDQWIRKYLDPIVDIDEERKEIEQSIEKFKLRKRPKQLKDEEEKLALLLLIIEAQQAIVKPDIFSDQELQSLIDELEMEDIQSACEDLAYYEKLRPGQINRKKTLEETDQRIQKLKRLIQLFQKKDQKDEEKIGMFQKQPEELKLEEEIQKFQKELNDLKLQEEIDNKLEAEQYLSFEENLLKQITDKKTDKYQKKAKRIANLNRIIELSNKIATMNPNKNFIDYSNAYKFDPKDSKQDSEIERAINAMNRDKEMPDCFQMSMNKAFYFSNLLLYEHKDQIFKLNQTQMKEQLAQNLGSLINKYNNEGYENQEVKKLIFEVEQYGNTKNELEKIIKNIFSVQIKHRFFNFREFLELLSINEKSAETLEGKDIILLLGSTGCGKSTTVHYLCGSKMQLTEKENLLHIEASLVINKDLFKVKCSPLAKSETRYVTPIEIDLAQLGQNENQIITLVDTPGSQDTESCEVDISNSIGVIRAVRQTKGVRLAILFSYLKLGARGEDIKKLIAFYSGLLKDIEMYLDAFSFFFTHVPSDVTMNHLMRTLEDGFKQLTEQEKNNQKLVILFKDLVEKAKKAVAGESKQVHILRPLDGQPINIHQSILQTTSMRDTFSFQERIDELGKFQVLRQFRTDSEAIISAIKRNDGKLALYLIDQLLLFQKKLPQDQIFQNNIMLIFGEVIQHAKKLFRQGTKGLQRALVVSEDNNLTRSDLEEFQSNLVQAKSTIDPFCLKMQTETQFFLKDDEAQDHIFLSDHYINHLNDLLEESLENLCQNTNDLANPLWNRYAKKYLLVQEYFSSSRVISKEDGFVQTLNDRIISQLKNIFSSAVDQITEETQTIIEQMTINDFIIIEESNRSQMKKMIQNLTQLVKAFNQSDVEILIKPLDYSIQKLQKCIKGKYYSIRDSQLKDVIEVINELKRESQKNVSFSEKQYNEDLFFEVTLNHVESIKSFIIMHYNLSQNLGLISGINPQFLEELENHINDFEKYLLKIYNLNKDKLSSVIQQKVLNQRKIKKFYDQIQYLRSVPFIQNHTRISYDEMIFKFEQLVESQQKKITRLIPDIGQ